MKSKNETKEKCPDCGGKLSFRRYGLIDNEGIWHSNFPDWYRCVTCQNWHLAYTIIEKVQK